MKLGVSLHFLGKTNLPQSQLDFLSIFASVSQCAPMDDTTYMILISLGSSMYWHSEILRFRFGFLTDLSVTIKMEYLGRNVASVSQCGPMESTTMMNDTSYDSHSLWHSEILQFRFGFLINRCKTTLMVDFKFSEKKIAPSVS